MHQIKTYTLELANLGKPMDPEDIIAKVLRGLNTSHYRTIKEMVQARDTPISFDALHEKLINHDLKNPEGTSQLPKDVTICQYCSYEGHTFPVCRNFKKAHPFFTLTPYTRPNRYPNNSSRANTVVATVPNSPSWLVDSGATHHLTNDLSVLASHTPYDGPNDVLIGDGSSLPISNMGAFDISSSSSFSPLRFRNVLHVPSISRNILSVSQFCVDNNAIVEFSSTHFLFKDTSRGRILLHGTLERGIYCWHPSSACAFVLPPTLAYPPLEH
ncbi:hypothetical protein vseg_002526 [Gypsophila vaccaria]